MCPGADEAEKWLAEQSRKWESVRTHVNRFNGGQTTHKTGPRGGKIKSTVYKDWVAAHGGEWVGFQWRPL